MRNLWTHLFLIATALLLAGCGEQQGSSGGNQERNSERQGADQQETPPIETIEGEGYEVVRIRSLGEANPDFYEGPIEESGVSAGDVDVILEEESALQAAYNDSTTQLTDYDLISLNFWADEVDGEIIDEMFFFRTPEAQEAYQQEAMGNLQELTE